MKSQLDFLDYEPTPEERAELERRIAERQEINALSQQVLDKTRKVDTAEGEMSVEDSARLERFKLGGPPGIKKAMRAQGQSGPVQASPDRHESQLPKGDLD